MKLSKTAAIAALALLVLSASALTGCEQVQNAANEAKNTVTSIVDKVNTFEGDKEASTLESTLRDFYSGVIAGTVNETTYGQKVTATLPASTASASERNEAAKNLTVLSALESQGMTSRFTETGISEYVFLNGSIRYKSSLNSEEGTGTELTYQTALGTLF